MSSFDVGLAAMRAAQGPEILAAAHTLTEARRELRLTQARLELFTVEARFRAQAIAERINRRAAELLAAHPSLPVLEPANDR